MDTIRRDSPDPTLLHQLSIDCTQCYGLCCVALYLMKSNDFPEDKPSGTPCRYLSELFDCAIHSDLSAQGRKGCVAYDCCGAGQFVSQVLYSDCDWRVHSELSEKIYEDFQKALQIHRMLWYLGEAACLTPCATLYGDIDTLIQAIQAVCNSASFETIHLTEYRVKVNPVLKQVGTLVAARYGKTFDGKGGSYLGKRLLGSDLCGKDFSMSLLIAANLQGCDLSGANFLGADLRDANIQGANLRDSIFLTQNQVNAAHGDADTLLPPMLSMPSTWRSVETR